MQKLLTILASTFLAVFLSFGYLGFTESGLNTTLNIASWFVPGSLSLTHASGTLLKSLHVDAVTFKKDNLTISAQDVSIAWQWWALPLVQTINIQKLQAKHITIDHPLLKHRLQIANLSGLSMIGHNGIVNDFSLTVNPKKPVKVRIYSLGSFMEGDKVTIDAKATGTLDEQPLHAHLAIKLGHPHKKIELATLNLDAKIADNTAKIDLHAAPTWQLNWNINAPQLALDDLDITLSQLKSKGRLVKHGASSWQLTTDAISIRDALFKKTNAQGSGSLSHHTLSVVTHIHQQTLQLAADGGWENNLWKGTLQTFNFISSITHNKHWSLKKPVPLTLSKTRFNMLQSACLQTQSAGSLCMNGLWEKNKAWRVSLNSEHFPLTELDPILPLSTYVDDIKGELQGQFVISGQRENTHAKGHFKLTNGSAFVPALNITLQKISATIDANNGILHYNGTAYSGKNHALNIHGHTQLNAPALPTTLSVKADQFLIADTPQFHVQISPDLTINTGKDGVHLKGHIAIPSAQLSPNTETEAVSLPDDVVFVHREGHPNLSDNTPLSLHSDLDVTLGDKVQLKFMGITGQLRGHLALTDSPTQPTVALGELSIHNGTYSAYGQTLTIAHGSLHFAGPLTQPHLDIQAIRAFGSTASTGTLGAAGNTLTVGINVTGNLQRPRTRLFSQPSGMAQSDILSYLVIGESSSQTRGAGSAHLLLEALNTLNITGGSDGSLSKLTTELRDTLGLSTLAIESSNTIDPNAPATSGTPAIINNTALALGKYLSPKLYIKYSVGILDAASTFEARYFLNKRWSIQTQTNTIGSGVDLLYTIER